MSTTNVSSKDASLWDMPSNREEGQSSSHSEDLQRAQPEEFHQKNEIDLVGFFIFLMKQDLFKCKERKTQLYIFYVVHLNICSKKHYNMVF